MNTIAMTGSGTIRVVAGWRRYAAPMVVVVIMLAFAVPLHVGSEAAIATLRVDTG